MKYLHDKWTDIATRKSTWLAVLSLLLTNYTALSTGINHYFMALNFFLVLAMLWQARHEGRVSVVLVDKSKNPPNKNLSIEDEIRNLWQK